MEILRKWSTPLEDWSTLEPRPEVHQLTSCLTGSKVKVVDEGVVGEGGHSSKEDQIYVVPEKGNTKQMGGALVKGKS